ncbi:branched-chain amino acid ABC transporter permease [Azospira restricta]|uniref:Branched-chain amino acid ABC transporter permease n=1 Tax=Azospira restricta TaxID=404405 RepID=A0A974SNE6_9RHOO|nr:branched-chain amino acid ABC transporter permease [Azospira restricta]QRJ63487.1 branched-chain amino acid ABC transporter permease [Azospira restricta]
MNTVFGKTGAAYLAGVVLLLLAPLAIYPVLVMKVLCFALFACAFNLLLGYTGLLSFGHAAFLGSAAYLTGHALKVWEVPTLVGLLLGTAGAAALGWVVGSLAIRRQGIYFTMTTLALAQMVYFVFIRSSFTGGEDGLQDVPRGSLFGIDLSDDTNLYYLVVAIFCGAFWLIRRIIDSPFGQILKAIRENEPRTISLGYDVARYKLLAFVLSAALAGLAGATKTLVFTFATLTDAHWHASGEVVLMTLVGGVGTVLGPLVGATVIVALQNLLADKVGSLVTVIMGVIFVLCVLAFRRGVVGESIALYRRMIGEKP